MSDQSETTANKPTQTQPCKMGCGFFGSNATGDCCSKCWREHQRSQGASINAPTAAVEPSPDALTPNLVLAEQSGTNVEMEMKVDEVKVSSETTPKKRKKKASYKAMMAGMMAGSGSSADVDKQKDKIRSVTGGGAFVKIDKI